MRTLLTLLTLLSLAACGGGSGDRAIDPGGSPSQEPGYPSSVPAADGKVQTRNLAMVMDRGGTDGRPELCLGAVAESYPPQCGGPVIHGWDWQGLGRGMHEQQDDVRWGEYHVTGRWDGESFTATDAIPAALYDTVVPEEPTWPEPGREYSQGELDDIAREVAERLPGAQGSYAAEGHAFVDVVYDDGTLQAFVDERFGKDVVLVHAALIDAT